MIYSIVVKYDPSSESKYEVLPNQPPPRRGENELVGIPLDRSYRYGLTLPSGEDAEIYAKQQAERNPGVQFIVLKAVKSFECPPSAVVEKIINRNAELVPAPVVNNGQGIEMPAAAAQPRRNAARVVVGAAAPMFAAAREAGLIGEEEN